MRTISILLIMVSFLIGFIFGGIIGVSATVGHLEKIIESFTSKIQINQVQVNFNESAIIESLTPLLNQSVQEAKKGDHYQWTQEERGR